MSNTSEGYVENQLPPYDSCMKLDNYVTGKTFIIKYYYYLYYIDFNNLDDTQEFHLFTGEQPPRNEWRHQNAVPFRLQDFQE